MTEPLCDIVLLTWNRADLLVPCVERILMHTDVPSRLLVIDNASTEPEAVEFLERIKGNDAVQVEVVRRAKNEGFSAGMNDGLARTTARWVCLLNNDTLVTRGWLSEMIKVAESNPEIGLLNPMTSELGLAPLKPGALDETAESIRHLSGKWMEFWSAVGFCMLMPRAVYEKVGPLDAAKFGFMYFEDADYSMKVRQAGWRCGIAKAAYVYHMGSGTMNKNPEKVKLFEENRVKFLARWGLPASKRIACVVPPGVRPDAELLRQHIRELANQDHTVWVFCTKNGEAAVPDHLNVRKQVMSPLSFYPVTLSWLVLKKKNFQKILVADKAFSR